tara:strand:- start:1647 stop:2498 length:852 start_codon:yes stop_codon:yes gene_type:complete
MEVAKELEITTIYTQHGSVGKGFPVLNFDVSMLDGAQAVAQYSDAGTIDSNIVITGRDSELYEKFNRNSGMPEGQYVGLATNCMDSLLEWNKIIENVRRLDKKIVLRCHPAESRKLLWAVLAKIHGVTYSKTGLDEFLQGCEVLITGVSGVSFDAAVRQVPVLTYIPSEMRSPRMSDYYCYQRYGLCRRLDNPRDVVSSIEEIQPVNKDVAGIFESGLIHSAIENKRAVLNIVKNEQKKQKNLSNELQRKFGCIEFASNKIFSSKKYIELIERWGSEGRFDSE